MRILLLTHAFNSLTQRIDADLCTAGHTVAIEFDIGDRGPSALDWALLQQQSEWGVTVLQAQAKMDAGPV